MKFTDPIHSSFPRRSLPRVFSLLLVCVFLTASAMPILAQSRIRDTSQQRAEDGYSYTVERGDSWSTVSEATGVPVNVLKEANPDAVRATDWLIVGEELFIPAADAVDEPEPEIYVVGAGESWNSIAESLGITAAALKAANPLSIRTAEVLYVGERLVIPRDEAAADATPAADDADVADEDAADEDAAEPTPEPTEEPTDAPTDEQAEEPAADATDAAEADAADAETEADAGTGDLLTYIVQAGESWNSIAVQFGISAQALREANPELIRPGLVLYREDKLVIPGQAASAEDTAPATDAAAETEATDDEAAEEEAAPAEEAAAEEVVEVALPECPADFADYPDAILALLNTEGADVSTLDEFLTACNAVLADGMVSAELTGDELEDLVVVYVNPTSDTAALETELLILNGTDAGYELGHRAGAAGEVRVLATEDINDDEQADVVWVDTNCGASTCFDTVKIYSWTGQRWSNWAEANITMAYADVSITDTSADGQGREIMLDGGVYGSVGAGPQRSRTETWGSPDGEPYTLLDTTYASSNCLYHKVLDANRAFAAAPEQGFEEAEALYTDAVSDGTLVGCWVRENEIDELQSFSYFRLALIAAYQGVSDVAGDLIGSSALLFPDNAYTKVGDVWLSAFEEGASVAAACDAVLEYLDEAPEAWQLLADYGYANPSFTAEDVCPVLNVEAAPADEDDAGAAAAPADAASEEAATEEEAAADSESTDAASEDVETDTEAAAEAETNAGAEVDADTTADAETTDDAAATAGGLAACPENVDRFASVLPEALVAATDSSGTVDADAIDGWLRECDALDDSRGAFAITDLNDDGIDDAVFMPTIVSDLGYGPGGSQGAVLIYHGAADDNYSLVFDPDIYGQPALLATEDLNEDGRLDVAWSVESCSTFCVLEVQMVAWNGTEYVPGIEPGATIAEGEVEFVELGTSAPGQGQALLFSGGVSGVPEGGIETPHTENWQSVDGAPYARLEWVYDRTAKGNDCVGLRLVEADVAMQAADVLGYDDAIGMYTNALDSSLTACSLYGIPGDEELILLQGLASFRLIQAQALNGDATDAQASLLALQSGQPDSDYTTAAATWLEMYNATGDPDAACDAVEDIFLGNDDLWRITDQFGFNHPALAAEQICFRP